MSALHLMLHLMRRMYEKRTASIQFLILRLIIKKMVQMHTCWTCTNYDCSISCWCGKNIWTEAIATATYLWNRIPNSAIKATYLHMRNGMAESQRSII